MTKNDELLNLARYCFPTARSVAEALFEQVLEFSTVYSAETQGKLTSMMLGLDYEIFWNKKTAKMAGVGLVGSYPEARGQGHIRHLMTQFLEAEYEKGTELSYLSPFSYQFYKKFGYEYAFDHKTYELAMTDWPLGEFGSVERLDFETILPEMKRIFEQQAAFGDVKRTDDQWVYHFQTRYQPKFALTDGGYLIYDYNNPAFTVLELVTLTEEAKKRLYSFISAHSSGFEQAVWRAPINTRLEEDMLEPRRAKILIQPDMQARIVNLEKFFELNGQPDFAVEISDPILPQNNGIYGLGNSQPEKLSIGQFTARILRQNGAILREDF
ncbi:MAG: GNAT family N-acetyltransferase [Streptococcaceae bacterium]|jgi:predicted acetyltransferase|nr:GNAT family N-acetyltransferase [Streptococcaceae bacterium]